MAYEYIVYAVVMIVISACSYFYAQSQIGKNKPKPATLSDFDMPTASEGTPQCVVFGDVWIPDWCVLSYGHLRTKAVKTKSGK